MPHADADAPNRLANGNRINLRDDTIPECGRYQSSGGPPPLPSLSRIKIDNTMINKYRFRLAAEWVSLVLWVWFFFLLIWRRRYCSDVSLFGLARSLRKILTIRTHLFISFVASRHVFVNSTSALSTCGMTSFGCIF